MNEDDTPPDLDKITYPNFRKERREQARWERRITRKVTRRARRKEIADRRGYGWVTA